MSETLKKHGVLVAFVVVVVLALYPLSYGPVMWLQYHVLGAPGWSGDIMHVAYAPSQFVIRRLPAPLRNAYGSYLSWWATGCEDAAGRSAEWRATILDHRE